MLRSDKKIKYVHNLFLIESGVHEPEDSIAPNCPYLPKICIEHHTVPQTRVYGAVLRSEYVHDLLPIGSGVHEPKDPITPNIPLIPEIWIVCSLIALSVGWGSAADKHELVYV